ncbi:MAG: molybdopterin cofactor-binding domain-containing protein [Gammaproteobacteria bacterium]
MLSRRGFILSGAAVGGGLIVAWSMRALDDGDAAAKFAGAGAAAHPLNAWLKIDTDGIVTCAIHRAEMGQGVTTGLAQLLIEELDGVWADTRFEFAPVDRDYFNFGILEDGRPFGDPDESLGAAAGTWAMRRVMHAVGLSLTVASTSIIDAWDTLRPAGAAARQMLIAAAARRWDVDAGSLHTEPGFVVDAAGTRRASYGELAAAAADERPPSDPPLKPPADYRLVGRDVPRLDAPMKVDGSAVFASDVELPDMLYAAIVHSPVVGSNVESYDATAAAAMPGVERIVRAGDNAVAVVASDTWSALQAADAVTITAAPVDLVDTDDIDDRYFAKLDAEALVTIRDDEGTDASMDSAAATAFAEYTAPYLAHECMEPMSCVAHFTGDALSVWAGTQSNSVSRDVAAALAGLDKDKVEVHSTFLGGGFGRRAEMDSVTQAVAIALQFPGRPIKLTWSRQQDTRHGAYRPLAVARVRGAVDGDGALAAIDYRVVAQSVGADYARRTPSPRKVDDADDRNVISPTDRPLYSIANLRVGYVPVVAHVPVGFWRSVAYSLNPFFLESFIDELAHAANTDPLAFRRRALAGRDRHLAVLDAVEDAAGPAHPGRGYALVESHGSVIAHAIDVETEAGEFSRVARVTCAIDCGRPLHPDNIVAQTEGCIFNGLAAALYGRVDIENGRIRQRSFGAYARYLLADQPRIDVRIVPSERRPGGVGEVSLPGVAPALCNAIFAATGRRVRKLPIR